MIPFHAKSNFRVTLNKINSICIRKHTKYELRQKWICQPSNIIVDSFGYINNKTTFVSKRTLEQIRITQYVFEHQELKLVLYTLVQLIITRCMKLPQSKDAVLHNLQMCKFRNTRSKRCISFQIRKWIIWRKKEKYNR